MADEVKVLMMGGIRSGKTSVLASLFNQAVHGIMNDAFNISDTSLLPSVCGCNRNTLADKRIELISAIENAKVNSSFMLDKNPNSTYYDYSLRIQIPSINKIRDIIFRDSCGSIFDAGCQYNTVVDLIRDCDVAVVVIDTPYLMVGSDVEAELANMIESTHCILSNIGAQKAQQVIFVPVKCEKWAKEGKIDDVVSKVEDQYSSIIKNLSSYNVEISIIPVQTIGDVVFEDLRDPYVLANTRTNAQYRCSKISNRLVNLANGEVHKVAEDETVSEDWSAKYTCGGQFTDIIRRTEWFQLTNDHKPEYRPHNCEQILLHILRFMFSKEKAEADRPSWIFRDIVRKSTARDMQKAIEMLSHFNLIKDNVEGIKVIKRAFS